jgi:hypothetical protein
MFCIQQESLVVNQFAGLFPAQCKPTFIMSYCYIYSIGREFTVVILDGSLPNLARYKPRTTAGLGSETIHFPA